MNSIELKNELVHGFPLYQKAIQFVRKTQNCLIFLNVNTYILAGLKVFHNERIPASTLNKILDIGVPPANRRLAWEQ